MTVEGDILDEQNEVNITVWFFICWVKLIYLFMKGVESREGGGE